MAFRLVTGNISSIVGAANNATVKFRLSAGSYTSQAQYLKTARNAITNAQGYFEIRLWVNTEGIIPTRYVCILPDGESFEFSLEPGTTPVDISAARAFGQSAPPAGTTLGMIEAMIAEAVAAHDHNSGAHPNGIAGDSGPGGDGGPIKIPFSYGDATPKPIITLPSSATVFTAQVIIQVPFNGVGSALSLGDTVNSNRLISTSEVDPAIACKFSTNPGYTYGSSTSILLSIIAGSGATTGSGFVLLEV